TGANSYAWAPAAGLSATNIANPVASPAATTKYIVTGTEGASCSGRDTVIVTVNELPIVNAGTDVEICIGVSTTLNATGNGSFEWSPATGLSATNIANPVANPTTTTPYTVTLTNPAGCKNSASVTVTVNQLPLVNAGSDITICKETSTTLAATGAASYPWSPATGLSATNIANPVASPTADQIYTVTGTDATG